MSDQFIRPDCCVEEMGTLIQNLVRTLQIFERSKLSKNGFTLSQYYTLYNIALDQTLTMNQLSERMNLDTSTMTRVVSTLVRDGYVTREKWEEDRRVIRVKLTREGQQIYEALTLEVKDYYRLLIGAIPPGEISKVMDSVNILLNAFAQIRPFCC